MTPLRHFDGCDGMKARKTAGFADSGKMVVQKTPLRSADTTRLRTLIRPTA